MRTTPTGRAILTLRRLVREPGSVEGRLFLARVEKRLLEWLAEERAAHPIAAE